MNLTEIRRATAAGPGGGVHEMHRMEGRIGESVAGLAGCRVEPTPFLPAKSRPASHPLPSHLPLSSRRYPAMADISYAQSQVEGTELTGVPATAGPDRVRPNDRGMVIVHNGGGVATDISIVDPGATKYGKANPDLGPTSVPAGEYWAFGPFPVDLMDPIDDWVDITANPSASVTFYGVRA